MRGKRIIGALVLCLVVLWTLTGCGKKETEAEPVVIEANKQEENTKEPEEASTEEVSPEEVTLEPEQETAEASKDESEEEAASGEITTEEVWFDENWTYGDSSLIHSGCATLYHTGGVWNGITVGVNAGHGTEGGTSVKTYCHPDRSAKVTGGSTAAGALQAAAVSTGMTFNDGTPERSVTLAEAQLFRDKLLEAGYDVLMIRDGEDVQLDNVARTVICNNMADCHIAIHWDGDGLGYDKGCFYISVPDGLKYMEPVASMWQQDDALGSALVGGLQLVGATIYNGGSMSIDLTQTSYSTVPSVDMEMGNQSSDHSEEALDLLADGLLAGVNSFFGK